MHFSSMLYGLCRAVFGSVKMHCVVHGYIGPSSHCKSPLSLTIDEPVQIQGERMPGERMPGERMPGERMPG